MRQGRGEMYTGNSRETRGEPRVECTVLRTAAAAASS